MKQYIYVYKRSRLSRYFLCKRLKKKGYTFRNNMSKEHIFANPLGKYAFCMCSKIASDDKISSWASSNCLSRSYLIFFLRISLDLYVKNSDRFIQHVVYSHREGLRWYFISTETKKRFMISLYPIDILLLFNGLYLLIPPLKKSHINNFY